MTKLLTIAVPSYNVEQYLDRGLSSFADERLRQVLEVIVVNDGSTDATAAIAQRYVDAFPDLFVLVNKENGGHGSAVNAGIAHATGRYFRVVDGDDWVETEGLVRLLDELARTDADIVVDEMSRVDMATMRKTHEPLPAYIETGAVIPFESICNVEQTESYIAIHTLTVKTALLRDRGIRISEGIFYVDYEFIVKATCFARTALFVPVEVYQYLVGNANQSMAAQNMVNRYLHHEQVIRALLAFADAHEFPPAIERYLKRKIRLIVHTHYNVLLIFDTDRARGAERARAFRAWLKREHPALAQATAARYRKALVLHYLGFDSAKLDRLMGRGA